MKVAKNMDSVFANCTDDELMFDILFDDDETIIDVLAGVDEAGNLITECYVDEDAFDEAEDMVGENPDFEYQNDGDASGSEKDAEGSKEVKPEVGGEVGDGKEVSGKEDSAESHADDTKDEEEAIGMNDKQQVKLEDAAEGPLEDDDPAEREGEVGDTAVETESAYVDSLLDALDESEDPIEDGKCPVDCDKRAGEDHGVKDTEGKDTEVLGASIKGSEKKDVIADIDDAEQRDGKAENKDTEGVSTHVVGAALEAADDEAEEKEAPAEDSEEEGCCKESVDIDADILAMLEADEEAEAEEDAPEEGEAEGCCKEEADVADPAEVSKDDAAPDPDPEDAKAADAGSTESCKESVDIDADILAMLEAEDPIEDGECPVDTDKRAGKDHGVKDTEGKDTEVLGASIVGDAKGDPIVDLDDAEQRDGKAESGDTEGVKTHVVGAALEASDYVDDLLASLDDEDDDDILAIAGEPTVPDSVKNDGTDNADIKVKESVDAEELVDEDDDDDIEAIDKEEIPAEDPDIEYDYDDDELIDAVINGDIDKLTDEE